MNERRLGKLAIVLVATLLAIVIVAGAPLPPQSLERISSSRREESSVATVDAIAGNVTELFINITVTTKTWAGYYGNISGTITLDDAYNNTLYSWAIATPKGEIYAARNTVDFSSGNIICPNSTVVADEETALGVNEDDADGVNETFSFMSHPAFSVGDNSFAQDECNFTISTYVDDQTDNARRFNETLVYDKANSQLVYTSLLAADSDGFKVGDEQYDFQMLVGENGHGNSDTTLYYFYVEIY
ncbi:hypothetical protein JXA85_00965 [Candidatus Woesearchaeota archaeon]|nr:hypothetical protein [Candidatus Woesearchaeota archaeon]